MWIGILLNPAIQIANPALVLVILEFRIPLNYHAQCILYQIDIIQKCSGQIK